MPKNKQPKKGGGSSSSKPSSDTITIPVDSIYFTHSKIYPNFSGCGKKIVDTIEEITSGKIKASDLPIITVHPCSSNPEAFFSLNNRRLYVFKELMKMGELKEIEVRLKPLPAGKRNQDRYTEEKCSKNCRIMKKKEKEDVVEKMKENDTQQIDNDELESN